MSRPITWALATLAVVAISSTVAGHRLSRTVAAPEPPRASRDRSEGRVITLHADLLGHFLVHPSVDGRRVRMLVDTGASVVALTHEDARLAGVQSSGGSLRRMSTANGVVAARSVRIAEMRIGEITVRNVDAVVMPPGALGTSLLGMSFLKRLPGFEMAAGRLTLRG
jgi:aspartyl protease family protein